MQKIKAFSFLFLAVLFGCKSNSTNPDSGEKLRLITSDLDTTSVRSGPVSFTLTVLDPSGYGVSGAYIDFYDPIDKRARHEGPTPQDGTLGFTDTVPSPTDGTTFTFAFIAERSGAIPSDSVHLAFRTLDLRSWAIDSVQVNSSYDEELGVKWKRAPADSGTDTVIVFNRTGLVNSFAVPYPGNSAFVYVGPSEIDTITVHNAYTSSSPMVWAATNGPEDITAYSRSDSNYDADYGVSLAQGSLIYMSEYFSNAYLSADFVVTNDPSSPSGLAIASASLSSLSGFSGRKTALYHPIQFIDSGSGLDELYYTTDLSHYVNDATPLYEIMIPDSSEYSTAFIAVTEDNHYAQVMISPITHDFLDSAVINLQISYQSVPGLPYAGRGKHR